MRKRAWDVLNIRLNATSPTSILFMSVEIEKATIGYHKIRNEVIPAEN